MSPLSRSPRPALSRRSLLGGAVGLTAGLAVLDACGSAGGSSSSSPSAGAPRTPTDTTWTDARGKRIEITGGTRTVVAQSSAAAALLDAGYQVAGAYGELTPTDGELSYQAGRLDLGALQVIGKTYGDFDLETYASLAPDLLVDLCFDDKTLWYVPQDDLTKVEQLAPTLGLQILRQELPELIDQVMRLSAALGGDTTGTAVTSAKSEYDAAVDRVRAGAKASGLTVVVMSGDTQNAYYADPDQTPDLSHLRTLGVDFPAIGAAATDTFLTVSWEQVFDHPADVILFDERVSRPTNAAWNQLPAVRAGQVYPWYAAAPFSYRAYAPVYREVAGCLGTE